MLSTENPPNTSCSCLSSASKGDERGGAHHLALQLQALDDQEDQHPHFSIRDYVFTTRSKDISVNWPFPQHLLQLCLNHGVKDVLPTFEPPDLMRGQCHRHGVRPAPLNAAEDSKRVLKETVLLDKEDAGFVDLQDGHVDAESSQPTDLSGLEPSGQGDEKLRSTLKTLCPGDSSGRGESTSALTSDVEISKHPVPVNRPTSLVPEINSLSEGSTQFEAWKRFQPLRKASSLSGSSDRKCGLIVKLGGVPESSNTEEITPNSIPNMETMTSKVCPVCKTFASTSNTTLNAHIDQCLAVESPGKQVLTDMSKHRVKSRKKRLMVDIYKTAAPCTLEDLDKRNGTNWSNDPKSPTTNVETGVESKRQRISQVDVADDGDDDRAVYVDSSGMKLCILSKFKNSPARPTSEDVFVDMNRDKNNTADTKEGKEFSVGKKKRLARLCSKRLKAKSLSKKVCALRLYKAKVYEAPPEASNDEYHVSNHEKEKSLSQLLKDEDSIKYGSLRPWVCSKRSDLPKKSNDSDGFECAGGPLLAKSSMSTSGNSMRRDVNLKFPRSSEDSKASQRNKRLETPLNITVNDKKRSTRLPENELRNFIKGTSTTDSCKPNLSRYLDSSVSSLGSKKVKINRHLVQPFPKTPESHPFTPKAKRSLAVRKNLSVRKPSLLWKLGKSRESRKILTFRKSQKDRDLDDLGKFTSNVDVGCDGLHDSVDISEPDSPNLSNVHTHSEFDLVENIVVPKMKIMAIEPHGSDKLVISEQESGDVSMSEQEESVVSRGLHSSVEYGSPDVGNLYSEDERSFYPHSRSKDQDSAGEMVKERAREETVSFDETHNSESNAIATCSNAQLSDLQNHVSLRPINNQDMKCANEEDVKSQAMAELETGSSTVSDLTVLQKSGASSSSPRDAGYEVLEKSSLTWCGPHYIHDQKVNGDQSGSPVSADSAVSPSPKVKYNLVHSAQDASPMGPPDAEDKVNANYSDITVVHTLQNATGSIQSSVLVSPRNADRNEMRKVHDENLRVRDSQPVKLSDPTCCCSRNNSISKGVAPPYQESWFLRRKGIVNTVVMPPKGRPLAISNPNMRPQIRPSFSTCLDTRNDELLIPRSDSSVGSFSTLVTSRAAVELQPCRDIDLGSPPSQTLPSPSSACSPVFRLMGKDLMVTRKDEDESSNLHRITIPSLNHHSNSKSSTSFDFSAGHVSNWSTLSSYRSSNDSLMFGLDPCHLPLSCDVSFSGGPRNPTEDQVEHLPPLQTPVSLGDFRTAEFMGSPMRHGSKSRTDGQSLQKILNGIPPSLSDNAGRSISHNQHLSSLSSQAANPVREVIVIKDSPERGPSSHSIDAKYAVGSQVNQSLPADILPLSVPSHCSTHMKAFPCFPLTNALLEERPVAPKPGFLMPFPQTNASSMKQGGSIKSLSHSRVFSMLPSSSMAYPNPAGYYSHGLQ